LSPLGRNFYLNITPNNLVLLYLRANSVPDGSPASVRVRELSSKDWEATTVDATNSLGSTKIRPNIEPPVSNCIVGRMSTDCGTPTFQRRNFDTNLVQKQSQSLTEIVTSLRNRSSVRIQPPGRPDLSVTSTLGNVPVRRSIPPSSYGNMSQLDSLCRVQSAPSIQHENQKDSSHSTVPCQASNMSESQCMKTPGQLAGTKFRFKRTSTTPMSSQVQSPSTVQVQPISTPYSQCPAAVVTVTSTHSHSSLTSASISTRLTAIGQTSNTAVYDMWDAGRDCIYHVIY